MLYMGTVMKAFFVVIAAISGYRQHRKSSNLLESISLGAFLIYVMFFIEITLFPILLDFPEPNYMLEINLLPFSTIREMAKHGYRVFLTQVIGNILLFVPLAFFLSLFFAKFLKPIQVWMIGFAISFSIEMLQAGINLATHCANRSIDVDDTILNAIGLATGVMFYLVFKRVFLKNFPQSTCFSLTSK